MGQGDRWIAGLLMIGVFAGTAWGQGDGPGGDEGKSEDKVKQALAAFVKQYSEGEKKKDEFTRLSAFDLLNGLLSDQRALDTVARVLGVRSETDRVKSRAVQMLGESGNPKAIPVLVKAFESNKRNVNLAPEIARSLGRIGDKLAVKEIDKIVRPRVDQFEDADAISIACAGIQALGRLRFPEAVDSLMSFFEPVQSARLPKGRQPSGPDETSREQQRTRAEEALLDSLKAITAQELGTHEEWQVWWGANKKTWKPQ